MNSELEEKQFLDTLIDRESKYLCAIGMDNQYNEFITHKNIYPEKLIYVGYSQIWKASNDKEETIALKMITEDQCSKLLIENEIMINNFLNENIPTEQKKNLIKFRNFYNFEMNNINSYFLVFDFANNKTVFELIKTKLQVDLPLLVVYSIFIQLLKGLETLHQHKIAHRDIKNENLLISTEGQVKLCDFQVAYLDDGNKERQPFYQMHQFLTKEYINPFKYENDDQEYNWFSYDIWCSGIALYEMIHSKIPFNQGIYSFNQNLIFKKGLPNSVSYFVLSLLEVTTKKITLNEIFSHEWIIKSGEFLHNKGINEELVLKEYCRSYIIESGLEIDSIDNALDFFNDFGSIFDNSPNSPPIQIKNNVAEETVSIGKLISEYNQFINNK